MKFEIANKDLFSVPQGYYLAHCISNDFALGAGIAKQFVDVYNMKFKLIELYRDGKKYDKNLNKEQYVGQALLVDNVFNLVTKERGFLKPTYDDLFEALVSMRNLMVDLYITKLAMPQIACGLDGLNWNRVEEMIYDVFEDTDIEILICEI